MAKRKANPKTETEAKVSVKSDKIRLDKWLWYTRQVKTRNLGSQLVNRGKFRVNDQVVTKASYAVKVGDVVSGQLHDRKRIFKVLDIGERRGPYQEAKLLYEDLSPIDELAAFYHAAPQRRRNVDNDARNDNTGRPTKKNRRQIHSFTEKRIFED